MGSGKNYLTRYKQYLFTILKSTVFVFLIFFSFSAYSDDIDQIRTTLRNDILRGRGATESETSSWLLAQRSNGSWPDINYDDKSITNWKPIGHLDRMLLLAVAYSNANHSYYLNTSLKKSLSQALTYYINKNPTSDNWYYSRIGEGLVLGKVLIALIGVLPAQQLFGATAKLNGTTVDCGSSDCTGQNLVWVSTIAIYKGCVQNKGSYILTGVNGLKSTVVISTGEGINPDYSYQQHSDQIYSGGYGAAYISDISYWINVTRNTSFGFDSDLIDLFTKLLLDGHRWVTRKARYDHNVIGREIARKSGATASTLATAGEKITLLNTPQKAQLQEMAEIIRGKAEPSLSGNRHFWQSDFMAHQRPDFYASVKMFSKRTIGIEQGNGENLKGYYLPHGSTLIYKTGNEYDQIFPVWDWTHIPGVTCAHTAEPPAFSGYLRGEANFVGGVSNGNYGMAAFDYSNQKVQARKAWFYFDEGFMCLGSGIASTDANMIHTSVNQCLKNGAISIKRGSSIYTSGSGKFNYTDLKWAYHDQIGYIFPTSANVGLTNQAQSGTWKSINSGLDNTLVTKDVFSLWLDHGNQPSNATYQYVVLPQIGVEDLSAYADNLPLTVIKNTKDIQAVRHNKIKVTGIVFYTAGNIAITNDLKISVDQPCMVLVQEKSQKLEISVSNPLNTAITVKVKINQELVGNGATWDGINKISTLTYSLPSGGNAGKSLVKEFSMGGSPDLVVTALTWDIANPKEGDDILFSASVKNQGNGTTPLGTSHYIGFWVDGKRVTVSKETNISMDPGEIRVFTANASSSSIKWKATAGSHLITAFADDVNFIAESNNDNNYLKRTLTVVSSLLRTDVPTIPDEVKIYPNPLTDDDLKIIFPKNLDQSQPVISIVDALNHPIKIKTMSINGSEIKLSFENLPSGIYFIKITVGDQNISKAFISSK